MPITFDEVTADLTPPPAPVSGGENRPDAAERSAVDPQTLARELQRLAERAARLNAD